MVGARPPAGMAQGRKARRAHVLTTGAAAEGCQPGALHVSGCSSRRASSASTRASCTSWRTSRRCWTLRSSWSTVGAVRGALHLQRRGLAAWPSSQFGARPGGALASSRHCQWAWPCGDCRAILVEHPPFGLGGLQWLAYRGSWLRGLVHGGGPGCLRARGGLLSRQLSGL